MTDLHQRWRELESALSKLVDELSAHLGERDRFLLYDFIENREFGVALEWLHSVVAGHGIALSVAQKGEMDRLAASMGIQLKDGS
jgi:hypothetical protein